MKKTFWIALSSYLGGLLLTAFPYASEPRLMLAGEFSWVETIGWILMVGGWLYLGSQAAKVWTFVMERLGADSIKRLIFFLGVGAVCIFGGIRLNSSLFFWSGHLLFLATQLPLFIPAFRQTKT